MICDFHGTPITMSDLAMTHMAMLRRNEARGQVMTRLQAKRHLKQLGWSYRRVAPFLGVHYAHLSFVLNGQRDSGRIMRAIEALQPFDSGKTVAPDRCVVNNNNRG